MVQLQKNNLASSIHGWRWRNFFLLLLACGIIAIYYVAIPPSGIEYNFAGYLTIRDRLSE